MSKQLSDLPAEADSWESIPTHEFTDPDTWQRKPEGGWVDPPNDYDSTFELEPPEGKAYAIHSVRIRYSAHAKLHAALIVEYWAGELKVGETVYASKADFIDRCPDFEVLDVTGNGDYTSPIWAHSYEFQEPLVLWSTPGPGRLTKMVLKIEDHQPFKQEGGADAEAVKVRYPDIAVYTEPS